RGVGRRTSPVHVDGLATYLRLLDRNHEEFTELLNVILINVTSFFRDPDAWRFVRERILPALVREASTTRSLRFWSAGCSSGEEPYSLAMLVAESLGGPASEYDVKIYGTDVD